eukprot:TRINITY_DN680_c1_g1_i1.p1 TRINITY_DN680_c1_g1~~TRINITY_DN680_c1_g1_i1.p1  ORF type:complete len:263 (+),score=99.63 TRINITY_DN680_c1_g1_i1:69-857(+)
MDGLGEYMALAVAHEETLHLYLAAGLTGSMLFGAYVLQFISAPYGRYSRGGWGLMLNATLAWVLQEAPALLLPGVCWHYRTQDSGAARVLLGMFAFHYFNRTCVFPFRIVGGKPTPFFTFFCALAFCMCNGYLIGRDLTHFAAYPEDYTSRPNFIAGCALFAAGWMINYHSDGVLRGLRKPGESGYKVPYGGAYNYVTAGNYFGELVEWLGFAVAAGTLSGWVFFLNTALNLVPRAVTHHQWYQEKFEDYPKDRKIIIPFIF